MAYPHTVVVIGSGFSGVATAAHLLRNSSVGPIRVVMVNRTGAMARGVAYGTNSPAHLLNVPAARMSAFPDDPEHFLRFLRRREPATAPGTFARRSVYGEYLAELLAEAEAQGPGTLERVVAEVASIDPTSDNCGVWVTTTEGRVIPADRVVLAIGHYPPANPSELPEGFTQSPRYVRDPWGPNAWGSVRTDRPALLLGTGLTMLDAALELHARGLPAAIAVSRRGLLPRAHDPAVSPATPEHQPPGITTGPATLRRYLHLVRTQIQQHTANGGNWRQVIDSLRPITPQLWQSLPLAEKERFFRHVRPWWDAHRHRTAPQIGASIDGFIASGWLGLRAAKVIRVTERADEVEVTIARRRTGQVETLRVGAVVNCTGPAASLSGVEDQLLTDLFRRGNASPDPLGIGIQVAQSGAVIGATGNESRVLWYVGPFLRARDGEGTAVPELRTAAARVASALAHGLGSRAGPLASAA